jgi:GrpB-like predicted nucleotidyltransferase (UPF0157 family)
LFVAEERVIRQHCGGLPVRLEHVGSTSIAGMCAKPVLDIAAGRPRASAIHDYVVAFERAGYEHRGERGVPGREFFRKGEPRAFHLHLVEQDGPLWNDYLDFRDYLRAYADDARQLAGVKRVLAARFARDREAYLQAKADHVRRILQLARADRGKLPSDHDH